MEGNLNGVAFIFVRSPQAVAVIGRQGELHSVQASPLMDLRLDRFESRQSPRTEAVKPIGEDVIALVVKDDDRGKPVASDHALGVIGDGLVVDRCAALRSGVRADLLQPQPRNPRRL
jgi:hypothetical protein